VVPASIRTRIVQQFWAAADKRVGFMTSASAYRSVRKGYDYEEEAKRAIERIEEATRKPITETTLTSYERLVTLYQQTLHVERRQLPGCLVECGVWRGGATAMMALASIAGRGDPRTLHLFDSFEGVPAPKREVDGQAAVDFVGGRSDGALVATHVAEASADEVMSLLVEGIGYPETAIVVHKGWFQDTIPAARTQVGQIALLRLDGDWYESTKVALENLYDQVVPQGFIVIDDYGAWEGCRRATDEFLAARSNDSYLHFVDYGARYLVR
jgi:hypothetical protein